MNQIAMQPIGVIHSPHEEIEGMPIQGAFDNKAEAWVELKDEYVAGLKDLDGFSHAILIYHFHRSQREEMEGRPFLEQERHGIFAIRSPHRPNHIGLSVVEDQEHRRQSHGLHRGGCLEWHASSGHQALCEILR